jgi:general secretion pathway protein M
MKEWISNLDPRERIFLGWGAVMTLGLLVYLFVLQPLQEGMEQAETQVKGKTEQLNRLQTMVREYKQLGPGEEGKTAKGGNESLLSLVDKTSSEQGLKNAIKRLTPEGDDKVRISLENAEFDKVVAWLAELAKEYRLHVDSLVLHPNDSIGFVNGNLQLQRL